MATTKPTDTARIAEALEALAKSLKYLVSGPVDGAMGIEAHTMYMSEAVKEAGSSISGGLSEVAVSLNNIAEALDGVAKAIKKGATP